MGQYHYLVNLTKKEFVHPHQIGNGLKLREQIGWEHSTSTALVMLLASSNGRGGGDFISFSPLIGSWAGDAVAFIGDYAEQNDLFGVDAALIYNQCESGKFKNISDQVREMMSQEFNIHYVSDGWLKIEPGPAPKESGWIEKNPKVTFWYPDSATKFLRQRNVMVIKADEVYLTGLDTGDKNRFKKFKKSRIRHWHNDSELAFFETGKLPMYKFNSQ